MQTYRVYLQKEFDRRQRKNPAYSLRAFAGEIGILPSKLSEVFSGRCGLSVKSASRVAGKIGLGESETKHFLYLVESEHGRSAFSRENARKALELFQAASGYTSLDLEKFRIVSDWYHMAILELTEVEDFSSDPDWIAQRLGISRSEVECAVQRLLQFNLLSITETGKMIQTQFHLATPNGVPSREIREHHSQILEKADDALESVSVNEREVSSTTMAISAETLAEAKEMIVAFRRRFAKRIQKAQNKSRVYCFSMQFFPLDKTLGGAK